VSDNATGNPSARRLLQLPSDIVKPNQFSNNIKTHIPNNKKFYNDLPLIYEDTQESLKKLAEACGTSIENLSTEESCQFVLSNPDSNPNARMGGLNENGSILPNDPHKTCNTPLIEAIFDEQPTKNLQSFIKKAIKAKKVIDLAATDISGKNIFMIIAGVKNSYSKPNLELVLELANKQGNDIKKLVNQPDRLGRTPLMIAAGVGNNKVVTLLLENGADLHAIDENGNNVIHYAALNKKQKGSLLHDEFGIHPHRDINAQMNVVGIASYQVDPECSELIDSELINWSLASLPLPKNRAQEMGAEFSEIKGDPRERVALIANCNSLIQIKNLTSVTHKDSLHFLEEVIEQNKNFKNVTVIEDSLNCQDKILEKLFNAGAPWKENKYGQFPASKKPIHHPVCKKSLANNVNQDRFFSRPNKKENRCPSNGYNINLKKTIA
jgi:ankyrin repeat protein